MISTDVSGVPASLEADLEAFAQCLAQGGLRAALDFLNKRTPHRYTGVFRFDGDMLRSVALIDKWDMKVDHGDDVPLHEAFCAHLQRTGEPLEVQDAGTDPRVPWMHGSAIVSYCGAVISDGDGLPWGALCHFDPASCESKHSEMPLLVASARSLYGDSLAAVGMDRRLHLGAASPAIA